MFIDEAITRSRYGDKDRHHYDRSGSTFVIITPNGNASLAGVGDAVESGRNSPATKTSNTK